MLRSGPLDRGRHPGRPGTRVLVGPDGALLREDRHGTRVLAQAGTVGAPVRVLDEDDAPDLPRRSLLRGWVVLPVDGGNDLALPLDLWVPGWHPPSGDPLEETGLRQVLQQLGRDDAYAFDVTPSSWSGPAEVVAAAEEERWWRTPLAPAAAALVGLTLCAVVGLQALPPLLTLLALAWGAVAWAVVRAVVWARRTSAPVPGALAEWTGALARTRVAAGADGSLVVVDESGRECSLPGPGEVHGARKALVMRQGGDALAVTVTGDRGAVLVTLPSPWWAGREERLSGLLDVVRRCGLPVEDVVVPVGRDPQVRPSLSMDTGLVYNAPSLLGTCLLALSPLGVAVAVTLPARPAVAAVVLPAAVVAAAVVAVGVWHTFRHRSLRKVPA